MLFWYNSTIHELMPATHVDFQSIRSTKLHLAHITLVGFLVRVNTHVSGQTGWSIKHLLANIALVPSLLLPSLRRRRFFSYLLLLDFKSDFFLVRNPQTQHQRFFFFHFFSISRHFQNRPRVVRRSFRTWIFPSRSIIRTRDFKRESREVENSCIACRMCDVIREEEEKKKEKKV